MKKHDVYRWLVSWIYPNVCAGCGCIIEYNGTFCGDCFKRLELYNDSFDVGYADDFTAYCAYKDIAREAVLAFKDDSRGNAYYTFAFCICEKLRQNGLDKGIDAVTCVPMYFDDLERRGYNQCELIAKEVRYMLDIPFENVLEKNRITKSQKSLSGAERRENLVGAFELKSGVSVEGRSFLIVDDLCTTGSTLSEAAKVLKEAGAKRVVAASFAKTVRNNQDDEKEENEESRE